MGFYNNIHHQPILDLEIENIFYFILEVKVLKNYSFYYNFKFINNNLNKKSIVLKYLDTIRS